MKMKYTSIVLIIFLSLINNLSKGFASDSTEVVKEKLHIIIENRKARFGNYLESLDQKTGFFGNQTKKDVKRSNEVLETIVRSDNEIFAELNKLLNVKTTEKTIGNFELAEKDSKILRQERALNSHQQLIKAQKAELEKLESLLKARNIFLLLLFFILIGIAFYSNQQRLLNKKLTRNT